MSIFLHSTGELKSTLNGNVISDKAFDATYDGKHMKITGHDNDMNFSKNLNNDDIWCKHKTIPHIQYPYRTKPR